MVDSDLPVSREMTIGEVARRSGVSVATLHFYESRGLIKSWRTSGNQRRYPRGVLRRIAIIKVAQRTGIPLADIQDNLRILPAHCAPSAADWQALSAHWRTDLDERIARLTRLRDQLNSCIGCGCLSLEDCPLRNPGDELAAQGCGPHLLEVQGGET